MATKSNTPDTTETTPVPTINNDYMAAANAAAEAQAAYIAPVRTLCESDEYAFVLNAAKAMRTTYQDDDNIYSHLGGLLGIMPRLSVAAGTGMTVSTVAVPVTMPVPVTPEPTSAA